MNTDANNAISIPNCIKVSYIPDWIVDFSTICSIAGLILSVIVLLDVKKIRSSFLQKARLPEVISEINTIIKEMPPYLQKIEQNKSKKIDNQDGKEVFRKFVIAKELLDNLKLPEKEQKKVSSYIEKVTKMVDSNAEIDSSKVWHLYTELSALATALAGLDKDLKWG